MIYNSFINKTKKAKYADDNTAYAIEDDVSNPLKHYKWIKMVSRKRNEI